MSDDIENPVADHQRRDDCDHASATDQKPAQQRECRPPREEQQQRVTVGIAQEVERRERSVAGIYPHLLEPEREKHGPQYVGQLAGENQQRERDVRRRPLRRQPQSYVSEKHRRSFSSGARFAIDDCRCADTSGKRDDADGAEHYEYRGIGRTTLKGSCHNDPKGSCHHCGRWPPRRLP